MGLKVLLKDLMGLTNVNLALSDNAYNIEVHDDFSNNPVTSINETRITIRCTNEDIVRIVDFNFDKNTITEYFSSDLFTGGTIYSMDGEIISIIN